MSTDRANFDLKEEIRAYWSARAVDFDESPSHKIEDLHGLPQWQAFVQQAMDLEPQQGLSGYKVLDLACGTGEISRVVCSLGADVTGLDFSEAMLAKATHKLQAERWTPLLCDAEHMGALRDESFDLLLTRHLAWTLTHPNRAFAEWYRVLKPGGRLLVNDGNWASPKSVRFRLKQWLANRLKPVERRSDEDQSADRTIRNRLPYGDGLTSEQLAQQLANVGFSMVRSLDTRPLYGAAMRSYPIADRLRQSSENRFAIVLQKPTS